MLPTTTITAVVVCRQPFRPLSRSSHCILIFLQFMHMYISHSTSSGRVPMCTTLHPRKDIIPLGPTWVVHSAVDAQAMDPKLLSCQFLHHGRRNNVRVIQQPFRLPSCLTAILNASLTAPLAPVTVATILQVLSVRASPLSSSSS